MPRFIPWWPEEDVKHGDALDEIIIMAWERNKLKAENERLQAKNAALREQIESKK